MRKQELTSAADHTWTDYLLSPKHCEKCGILYDNWLNENEWATLFCPGGPPKKATCCKLPVPVYLGGQWFCETCGAPDNGMKTPDLYSSPTIRKGQWEIEKKCTCKMDVLMARGCQCSGK